MSSEVSLKVHRIRFFVAELFSINCMTYDEENRKLALIRRRIRKYKTNQSDTQSVVQIWNMQTKAPFVEQTIFDDCDNPSLLEALVWAPKGRLFSCGLNSYVNEYDLTNNRIKKCYTVKSGPIWCMSTDVTKSLIAVGTEDGDICVFRIEDNGLEFNKMMDRNDNRILCLQWYKPEDNTSQMIITGSIDYIKIWNFQTGRCVDHIQVANNGIVVWCLTVLKDFTIISGDSSGKTSFWDGNTATLINSFNCHKGDVLSVCVDSNETTVYASGVDPDIVLFERTPNKFDSWVKSIFRRVHTHDVRAMTCVAPNWLISGGIDSYLTISCYPPNLTLRYLSNYSSAVTVIRDYVLVQYETYVQIWRLGKTDSDVTQTKEAIEILPLSECATKLADVKSRKPIISASFNDLWIAYSNSDNIKIKSWTEDGIKKVPVICEPISCATDIQFCGSNFVAIVSGTSVYVLKLDTLGVILQTRIDFENRVYSITTSDKYLAICSTDKRKTITIYETTNWTVNSTFVNTSLPTSFRINPFNDGNDLWIAYSDHKLICYKIEEKRILNIIKIKELIPKEIYQSIDEFWTIKQLCFATDSLLFSDDNNLFRLNTNTNEINKCDKYRHILRLGNTQLNELAVVELTSEMVFQLLPQTLAKKKFGV